MNELSELSYELKCKYKRKRNLLSPFNKITINKMIINSKIKSEMSKYYTMK